MKNKLIIAIFFLLHIFPGFSTSLEKQLEEMIVSKNWQQIPSVFNDSSYLKISEELSEFESIRLISAEFNQLVYYCKFPSSAEIGFIEYEIINNKFSNLKLTNQIKPLYFIDKLRKYKVNKFELKLGDALFSFSDGVLYETIPYPLFYLYKGNWKVQIQPANEEESLTLKKLYNESHFTRQLNAGFFIFEDKAFIEKLERIEDGMLFDIELVDFYNYYKDSYGIEIAPFKEPWYFPLSEGSNLAVFKKDNNQYYRYVFSTQNTPDTQLILAETQMILSYNSIKLLKFQFGDSNPLQQMNIHLFIDPLNHQISGNAQYQFKYNSTMKTFDLHPQMNLSNSSPLTERGYNVFRRGKRYFLLGPEEKNITLDFSGFIPPEEVDMNIFAADIISGKLKKNLGKEIFYFLSRNHDFYPNPGIDYAKTDIKVTLPQNYNCLASGDLQPNGDANSFTFSNEGSKGFSLVAGNFNLVKKIKSSTPLHLYTFKGFNFPSNINFSEIKNALDFFSEKFNPLLLKNINLLVRYGKNEGGVSNHGFIIYNFAYPRLGDSLADPNVLPHKKTRIVSVGPTVFRNTSEDNIIHEIAHQWWGGLISWKNYQDVWITEGLAHFSVLYYLKSILPESKFNRIISNVKRWALKNSSHGPIVFGARIHTLEKNYEAFQSIVYNKSALVFFMAMELVGETDFLQRLQSVLQTFRYRSITTSQFIKLFCQDNLELNKLFDNWIYSRKIPEVQLELLPNDNDYDTANLKTIVVSLNQMQTDFIFPVVLEVITVHGKFTKNIFVKEKNQRVVLSSDARIREVNIGNSYAPLREKTQ
jgi:hypothetical protein